jgi:hypothetical protein
MDIMVEQKSRGSEKLLAAWKTRTLTEESVREIGAALDNSPAKVESVSFTGGENATGVSVLLSYGGDDVPRCGNDIEAWLKWQRKHGGKSRPIRIIINGTPFPDVVRMNLEFGQVDRNQIIQDDIVTLN